MESYEPKSKSKSKQAPGVSQITNGYGADCVAGASAGAAFLKQMIADRAFYRLSLRVNELIRSGKPIGGFKVGFFTEIARTAGGATALSELYALDIGEHHRVRAPRTKRCIVTDIGCRIRIGVSAHRVGGRFVSPVPDGGLDD